METYDLNQLSHKFDFHTNKNVKTKVNHTLGRQLEAKQQQND